MAIITEQTQAATALRLLPIALRRFRTERNAQKARKWKDIADALADRATPSIECSAIRSKNQGY